MSENLPCLYNDNLVIVTIRQENIIDTLPLISLELLYVTVILIIERAVRLLLGFLNNTLYLDCRAVAGLPVAVSQVARIRDIISHNVYATRGTGLLHLLLLLTVYGILARIVILRSMPKLMSGEILFYRERLVAEIAFIRQGILAIYTVRGGARRVSRQMY